MNDQTSPPVRQTDDGANSPKRKKVRSKYAPKACVSCRRSKLKLTATQCSGENPCQRCTENGKRCFYSEDQTAAEALQNLSRPTPVQAPLVSVTANGNGINSRRNILPRHDIIERRASDASVLGLSMEARMARIEGLMETLIQERAATLTPRMSLEREEAVSDSIQSDSAMQGLGESFLPNFIQARQGSFKVESPERPQQSFSKTRPFNGPDSPATISVGSKVFPFPNPTDYAKSVDFFFEDLSHYYPCVNEAAFRSRGDKMLAGRNIETADVCFLALVYMVLACADISTSTQSNPSCRPSGWHWFQVADEIVGKKALGGQGDLSLIQYLILKDVHPDHPLPEADIFRSSIVYLNSMVCWARLAADVWDGQFAATVVKRSIEGENALLLDARIKQWIDDVLPTIPLLPPDASDLSPDLRQLRQYTLVCTRLSQLRLLIFRQTMLSLKYDGERGRICGDIALDIVERIKQHRSGLEHRSFRFSMASALASAFLVLSSLLVRDLSTIALQDKLKAYFDGFQATRHMLFVLSQHYALARRILDDFKDIIPVVCATMQHAGQPHPQNVIPRNVTDLFPYTEMDFAQQSGSADIDAGGSAGTSNKADVGLGGSSDADVMEVGSSEPWEFAMGRKAGRWGVAWI